MNPLFISKEEAVERFNLRSGKYDVLPHLGYETVVVIEGNTTIGTNLTSDTVSELFFNNDRKTRQDLIIINGDLTVKGDINLKSQAYKTYLLVLGNLTCEVLMSTKYIMHFAGDAHIQYVFNANYNDGITTIEGTTHVPYFLHSNHNANVTFGEETIIINYYGDDDGGWDYDFDYYRNQLADVLVEEVCPAGEFNRDLFIDYVKTGSSPFKEGIR